MPRFAELSISWRRHWRALAIMMLCMAAGLAQAQSAADADDSADPPGRVARLSYIAGDLGFLPAGAKDWSDASVNRPLTTGDKLSTAEGARAELEFGGGTLRIDGRTDLGLLDLNDNLAQIELTQGALSLTVQRLDDGQSYEIDTPAVALVIDQPGTFRVNVDDNDGSTRVSAFDGNATVFGENNAQRTINPGRSYRFVDASLSMVTITDLGGGDAFDNWASERDNRYARSTSGQYVSNDVVGYQDLDQYGDWQDTSEYGAVWFPQNVGSDWAPYRNGHWAYIAPWGWTWVDDAPWGFAPYHYGRWAYVRGGWGWIPGPRGVRPIYAPALVAFVVGGGWSIGIGSAPVGWFPLGPGEIYNPWYRCGRSYYTRVNIRNIRGRDDHDHHRDIDDHYNRYRHGQPGRGDQYANRTAPRGFTAVPGRTFAGGRHVQRDVMRVDPRKLAGAPVMTRGADRLRPVSGGATLPRNAHVRNLPAGGFQRPVVARHEPPAATPGTLTPTRDNQLVRSPRVATPPGNVRVLGSRPFTVDREVDRARRPSATQGQLPQVPRITTATPQGRPSMGGMDADELRSARYAHPSRAATQPRPGVSYISGNRSDPPRPVLPQAPQIQHSTPSRRLMPITAEERNPRYQPNRTMQRDAPPVRNTIQPHYQPPAPVARSYNREEPRPVMRREPMPQPRYQPPQRSAPAPRAQAPQPQPRSESRPANNRATERGNGKDWQH